MIPTDFETVFQEDITVDGKECYYWNGGFSEGYLRLQRMGEVAIRGEIAYHFHGPDFVMTRFTSTGLKKFSFIQVRNIRPERMDLGKILLTKNQDNIVLISDDYLPETLIFEPANCEEVDRAHVGVQGLIDEFSARVD